MTIFFGGPLDDVIVGTNSNDEIYGYGGNDTITGSGGGDLLYGGSGNDTFRFVSTSNVAAGEAIYGGTGHDRILISSGGDYDFRDVIIDSINEIEFAATGTYDYKYITIGTGALAIGHSGFATDLKIDGNDNTGSKDHLTIRVTDGVEHIDISGWTFVGWNESTGNSGEKLRVLGSDNLNNLVTSSVRDIVYSYGGNDILTLNGGNDQAYAGSGDDTVYGGAGNDVINGGSGYNTLHGGSGDDVFYGGWSGSDTIYGGSGNDFAYGHDGNDNLFGGSGGDLLYGQDGIDYIFGGNHSDSLNGGNGDDQIYGGTGPDVIYGGNGADLIYGGTSTDTIYAGHGFDNISVLAGENYDNVYGGSGLDTLDHSNSTYSGTTFDFDTGIITGIAIDGPSAVLSSIERYYDGSGSNTIISSGDSDEYWGQGGNDMMHAVNGRQTMHGGTGNDTIDLSRTSWGTGFDYDMVSGVTNQTGDAFHEFENAVMTRYDDTVTGTSGSNRITGAGGDDLITGGAGADIFVYAGDRSEGDDVISDFTNGVDHIEIGGRVRFSDLKISGYDHGSSTLIEWDHGSIVLMGVSTFAVDASDFNFV